jgi:hypothetical protein
LDDPERLQNHNPHQRGLTIGLLSEERYRDAVNHRPAFSAHTVRLRHHRILYTSREV